MELREKKVRRETEDPKETVVLRGPREMQGSGPDLEAVPRERKYAKYYLLKYTVLCKLLGMCKENAVEKIYHQK